MVGRAAARELLGRLGDAGGRIVELGVGSGVSSRLLLEAGWDVIGVDVCPPMLELAEAHAPGGDFRLGSLWTFDIPRATAVTAFGETVNYATEEDVPSPERLKALFGRVAPSLEPGGLFLFDVACPTRAGPDESRGARFEEDGVLLVMEEVEEDGRLTRQIDTFLQVDDNLYRRIEEVHTLVLFDPDETEAALRQAGFQEVERLDAYHDYDFQPGWTAFAARL